MRVKITNSGLTSHIEIEGDNIMIGDSVMLGNHSMSSIITNKEMLI